jgi:hypothetical protein
MGLSQPPTRDTVPLTVDHQNKAVSQFISSVLMLVTAGGQIVSSACGPVHGTADKPWVNNRYS